MPTIEECVQHGGYVAKLSGDRIKKEPLPGRPRMAHIKALRCAGETLAHHLRFHEPEVRVEVELPNLGPETEPNKTKRVLRWPLGGALRREGRLKEEPSAFIESLTRKSLIVAVRGPDGVENPESQHLPVTTAPERRTKDLDAHYPLLATLFEQVALERAVDLLKNAQDIVKLDSGLEESLANDPRPVEVANGDKPMILHAGLSDEAALQPAFPPMQNRGISSEISRLEALTMWTDATRRVAEFTRMLGDAPDYRKKMEVRLEAHRKQFNEAIEILEKRAEPLISSWMNVACLVDAAARQKSVVVTMDLPVATLLASGRAKIPMSDVDGKSFQELAFAELVVPWTAVDLTSSVSAVVLGEPVQSIDCLQTVGEFAAAQRTMVVATLATKNIEELQNLLELKPFAKDSEVWKRHVRVIGSNITVPDLHNKSIVISGAAALVAREIQIKSVKADNKDLSAEISRAVAGFSVSLIGQDSAFPYAKPVEKITDTLVKETHAKNLVTLLYYHETGKRLYASDAETLFLSDKDEAVYQFATSTQLANWFSRTVRSHVRLFYEGVVGTPEANRRLAGDIREWVQRLGRRKIIDDTHTSVDVKLLPGGVVDIAIKIGMPNLINAAEVAIVPFKIPLEPVTEA